MVDLHIWYAEDSSFISGHLHLKVFRWLAHKGSFQQHRDSLLQSELQVYTSKNIPNEFILRNLRDWSSGEGADAPMHIKKPVPSKTVEKSCRGNGVDAEWGRTLSPAQLPLTAEKIIGPEFGDTKG